MSGYRKVLSYARIWAGTNIICCRIRKSSFTPKVKGSAWGHINSVLIGNVSCRLGRQYVLTTHHFESSDVVLTYQKLI